jgi:hypothetical protein
MDLANAIEISKEYSKLGWAIQEQLERVIDISCSEDLEELIDTGLLNPNALIYIDEFLEKISEFVDSDLERIELIRMAISDR